MAPAAYQTTDTGRCRCVSGVDGDLETDRDPVKGERDLKFPPTA